MIEFLMFKLVGKYANRPLDLMGHYICSRGQYIIAYKNALAKVFMWMN